jgi:hypothetical protein
VAPPAALRPPRSITFAVDKEHKDTSVATIESGSLDLENNIFLKDKVLLKNMTRNIFSWLRNVD